MSPTTTAELKAQESKKLAELEILKKEIQVSEQRESIMEKLAEAANFDAEVWFWKWIKTFMLRFWSWRRLTQFWRASVITKTTRLGKNTRYQESIPYRCQNRKVSILSILESIPAD